MYCGKCGTEIPEGNACCINCGSKVLPAEHNNAQGAEGNVEKKTSKNKQKYLIISSIVLLVFLCFGFIKVKETMNYNKAVELYNMHYYVEARDLFEKTGNFKETNKFLNSEPYKLEGTWLDNSIIGTPPQKIIYELEPEGKVKWGMLADYARTESWNPTEEYQFGNYKILSVNDKEGGKLIMNDYIFNDKVIVIELTFVSKSTDYSG